MSTPAQKEPTVNIGAQELKDILMSVIDAARKPVVTDKELRDQAQAQDERKANAALVMQERANKLSLQKSCSHMRRDGSTRAVFVKGEDFMICQFCQAIIHGGERPASNPFPDHIYDNQMFNRLFQMAGAADIIL